MEQHFLKIRKLSPIFKHLLPGIFVQLEFPPGTFDYIAHVLEIQQIRGCSVDVFEKKKRLTFG